MDLRNKITVAAAIAGAALGGAALANAATDSGSTSSSSGAAATQPPAGYGRPPASGQQPPAQPDPSKGGHQANGETETLLTGDTAAKVKAAATAKVSGATVLRVETDADHGSPYEAHLQKSDGTQLEVLVDKDFKVTAVNTMGAPGQRP